jgi:hypothetical protein
MAEVPLLFQVPQAWLAMLLSEWLDMPSIGKLDTAMCSKEYRPQLLLCLQIMRSSCVNSFSDDLGHKFLGGKTTEWTGAWWGWLYGRKIYVEVVNLHGNVVSSVMVIPSIRKVRIEECNSKYIIHLVQSCPALQSLTLTCEGKATEIDERFLTETALNALSSHATNLEEFSYSRTASHGNESIAFYEATAAALIEMLGRCSKLNQVSLYGDFLRTVNLQDLHRFGRIFHGLWFGGGSTNHSAVSGQAISDLLSHCGNLRTFRYGGGFAAGEVRDRLVLTALHQSCPLLEELDLLLLSAETMDAVLPGLGRGCPQLQRLYMSVCVFSESNLRSISLISSLQKLSIQYLALLTNGGIASLAALSLTELSICEVFVTGADAFDNGITEAALQSFAGSNLSRTIEKLEIGVRMADRAMDVNVIAAAVSSCHKLTTLYVDWGRGDRCALGFEALETITTGCPLLESVYLMLTFRGCKYLATHCARLKKCVSLLPSMQSDPGLCHQLQARYPQIDWASLCDPIVLSASS